MFARLLLCLALAGWLTSCRSAQEEPSIELTVFVDGEEAVLAFARELSLDQALSSAGIELGARDRVSHPPVSPVVDGMRVTIRRVREEAHCERQEIAHARRLVPKEGIAPGERLLAQTGAPGSQERCYLLTLEDGIEVERLQSGEATVIQVPLDEIVYVGPSQTAPDMEIPGRLSYINHGNIWTISGKARDKRALTTDHNLDGMVFSQSDDGRRLLFTSETDKSDDFFNELWLADASGAAPPRRMTPTDVLYAGWRPRGGSDIAYSTGESRAEEPGWRALNNLWLMRVDLESGRTLSIEEALPEAVGGEYGWRGTSFAWSPLGDRIAWARAGAFGLVDFDAKRLTTLVDYAVFQGAARWIWHSSLSWSHDGQLLAGVAHGPPIADEPSEASPVFDITVSSADGGFSATLRAQAGMWAAPAFSPNFDPPGAEFAQGYIAWLEAREPLNSMSGGYDLVIADRDGSNQRHLFPPAGQPGIHKRDFGAWTRDFVWSPEARFIALIYAGDLWLIDIESGAASQITFDGTSSNPVWTR